jgi:hypothetical protein
LHKRRAPSRRHCTSTALLRVDVARTHSGGQMDGRITAYEADAHIAMLYTDTLMDVGVD